MSGAGSYTVLQAAIDGHDWLAVKRALDNGADANAVVPPEQPVLTRAVIKGDVSIVRLLLTAGASPNGDTHTDPPLFVASLDGVNFEVIAELVRRGADPNLRHRGVTALAMAALRGNAMACQALVENGARIDDWNQWPMDGLSPRVGVPPAKGRTALMIAAAMGHRGAVFMLLHMGANRELKDEQGRMAIDLIGETESPAQAIRRLLMEPATQR